MKTQLFLFTVILLCINTLHAQFGGGAGTETSPYQIYTKAHLEELNNELLAGNTYTYIHFRLMNDIDDSLRLPLGQYHYPEHPFNGYFHGSGYNIVLAIDLRNNNNYTHVDYALFPKLGSAAYIDSFSVSGYIFASNGLVRENNGEINSCINNLSSPFNPYEMLEYNLTASGICYDNFHIIKNCINNADLYGMGVGGICLRGANRGMGSKIINCTNNGNITGVISFLHGNDIDCGGIYSHYSAQYFIDTISGVFNCINNGNITLIKRESYLEATIVGGGISAWNAGGHFSIVNCQNYGHVILPDAVECGGILGYGNANIKNCANYGNIESYGSVDVGGHAGGIVGSYQLNSNIYYNVTLENCFNSGHINGNHHVGGIVATAEQYNQGNNMRKCLNVGRVERSAIIDTITSNVDISFLSNNYYDKQRCLAKGIDNEDITGKAEGKLTTELTGTGAALQAMLGNGWSYAEGRYPVPLGLQNDSRALLHATPIYLYADSAQYDHVDSVRHYFTASTVNNVTWAATAGKVSFDGQNATLLSLGSEILIANMGNYSYNIPINIVDTIAVIFPQDTNESITLIPANMNIRLYPNPATNELRIANYELQNGDKVEIYNMLGQRQMSIANNPLPTIDISSLPSGMYVIRVGRFVGKFVKQK